jgi:hypothetical protein
MKKIISLKNTQIRVFPSERHHTIDTFMSLAEYVAEQYTELTPEFWSFYEPINKPFAIQDIKKAFIFSYESYLQKYSTRHEVWAKAKPDHSYGFPTPERWLASMLDFYWKRKIKPKAWGSISALKWLGAGDPCHAHISTYADIDRKLEPSILAYLKQTSQKFNGHYGYYDSIVPEYKEASRANGTHGDVFVTSLELQKKLPDIFWSQVFGAPYVRLFGLQKLLNAPAYKVEQLGPEMVYIQLSETLFDMHERYAEVDAVRQRVKAHLDDNIFFKPENTPDHVYRTPDFEFPPCPQEPLEVTTK